MGLLNWFGIKKDQPVVVDPPTTVTGDKPVVKHTPPKAIPQPAPLDAVAPPVKKPRVAKKAPIAANTTPKKPAAAPKKKVTPKQK